MPVLRILTWNVYHGRDFPPDPSLFTLRSLLLRVTERNRTHLQVNRDLAREFAAVIAGADWDVALLQECPPSWGKPLAERSGAVAFRVLTSRNSLAPLRRLATRANPDLVGPYEGGSNLILARRAAGGIVERRGFVLTPGPRPERRTMALVRLGCGACVANVHASTGPENRHHAERELVAAAERGVEWSRGEALVLGGDLNVRPRDSAVYDELQQRFGLRGPTSPGLLDHLLHRGLEPVERPAPWPPEAREVAIGGHAIRLSDHAPVAGAFAGSQAPSGDDR